MKIETKEIYKCEHCNKLYQIKSYCLKHEISCHKNPDNYRVCFSCNHLEKKNYTLFFDMPDGSEMERKVDLLFCPKIGSFLYPPKVEHKGNAYELFDTNKPMPRTCKVYEDEKKDFESIFKL